MVEYSKIKESWGGVVAITILLILVVFAIFNSSGKKNNPTGGVAGHVVEAEDLREQQMNPRRITVKNGQKLVVF